MFFFELFHEHSPACVFIGRLSTDRSEDRPCALWALVRQPFQFVSTLFNFLSISFSIHFNSAQPSDQSRINLHPFVSSIAVQPKFTNLNAKFLRPNFCVTQSFRIHRQWTSSVCNSFSILFSFLSEPFLINWTNCGYQVAYHQTDTAHRRKGKDSGSPLSAVILVWIVWIVCVVMALSCFEF